MSTNSSFDITVTSELSLQSSVVLVDQLSFAQYCVIATGSAWIWESLNSIDEDVALSQKFPISLAHVIYILSKVTTLSFLISAILFEVVPYDICANLGRVCVWLLVPCALFSSLLFLIRVLAVYHNSKAAQSLFIFLWFGYLAMSVILPFMFSFTFSAIFHPMCLLQVTQGFVTFGIGYDIGYHTLVLLATSMRLLSCSLVDSWSGKLQVLLGGEGIPRLSRLLVRTDQLYYLVMLVMNILEAVATFGPSASPIYTVMVIVPSFALRNIAACHVYRKTKLGAISDDPLWTSSSPSSIRFALPLALAEILSRLETRSMSMTSSHAVVMESRDETANEV